mgnify:CR=1 FL=1
MLKVICREYRENISADKRFTLLYALLCFWRVPNFRVNVYIRMMQEAKHPLRKELISKKLCLKYGVEVGRNTIIGRKLAIRHISGIVLGSGAVIGNNVTLYHGVTLGQRNKKYPKILDGVTIYPNSTILGDVVIGRNSIVLASSVVLKDVPDNCIVAGNPANIVKNIEVGIEGRS